MTLEKKVGQKTNFISRAHLTKRGDNSVPDNTLSFKQ